MLPVTIDVGAATGRYTVLIGDGLASRLGRLLEEHAIGGRRFIVSNPVVWRFHGETLARAVPGATLVQVPDGERHKHLATVARIYEALVRGEADRDATVVAAGGGVIGDMAGFAAATYLRGLRLVHLPTTLLAQVDASIGGKVGVNLAAGKNLVGAFYPPRLVVTDPGLLRTLPRREFRAGMYEVIKYGVACDRALFAQLQRDLAAITDQRTGALVPVIAQCCRIKAAIVSSDEREAGPRRVLNFGHTAGHALETLTGYRRFRHGEAVGWGMLVAAEVAASRGMLSAPDLDAVRGLIMQLGPLPQVADVPGSQMIQVMRRDKKVAEGRLHFVLPSGIGSAAIVGDVTARELTGALVRVGFHEG
jgi:3-dehydroquinate synthase